MNIKPETYFRFDTKGAKAIINPLRFALFERKV